MNPGIEFVACAVCGSSRWEKVYSSRQNVSLAASEVDVDLVMCLDCAFLFNNPQPTTALLEAHYRVSSSGVVFKETGPESRAGRLARMRVDFAVPFMDRRPTGRILDVGCGNGFFLQSLPAEAWHRVGIDLAPQRGRKATDHDIQILTGNVLDFEPEQKFDIITCFSSFEHFRDPRVVLKKLGTLLNPDGVLILDVPDSSDPEPGVEEFFCFEHLSSFTRSTLTMFFNRNGFTVDKFADSAPPFRNLLCAARLDDQAEFRLLEDQEEVREIISEFQRRNDALKNGVRAKLNAALDPLRQSGGKIAVYGAGFHNYFLFNLGNFEDQVACFIDGDSGKWGTKLRGKPIVGPTEIPGLDIEAILISSHHFEEEIFATIALHNPNSLPVIRLYDDPPAAPRGAVICLAAGNSQLPVIRKARELGYDVLGVDRDPSAPGLSLCQEQIIASTHDPEAVLEKLRHVERAHEVVGVLNRSSGKPVMTAATLAHGLGLPGPTPEAAATLTDKAALMAACEANGIPAPRCQSVLKWTDIDHDSLGYPCVVKPAMSLVGKSGVTIIPVPAWLPQAFEQAQAASLNGVVNIEEFIPGRDFSLTALADAGRVQPLLLKDELTAMRDDGTIGFNGVAVPSLFHAGPEARAILDLAQELARVFRLDRTFFNLSCRCEKGGQPRIIEVHLDLGGDLFYEELLPACTDRDFLGDLIRFLAGDISEVVPLEVQPSALVFDKDGPGVSGRPRRIIQAETREELEALLSDVGQSR